MSRTALGLHCSDCFCFLHNLFFLHGDDGYTWTNLLRAVNSYYYQMRFSLDGSMCQLVASLAVSDSLW